MNWSQLRTPKLEPRTTTAPTSVWDAGCSRFGIAYGPIPRPSPRPGRGIAGLAILFSVPFFGAQAGLGPLDEILTAIEHGGIDALGSEGTPRSSALSLESIQVDEYLFAIAKEIPDGDFSGLSDTHELPPAGKAIQSIVVNLVLSPMGDGGFAGDLYATLAHEGVGYSVLLNRPGRNKDRPAGYSDNVPIELSLRDGAPTDVHRYRLTLTGDESLSLAEALSGPWQPDGRAFDPFEVVSSDARTAMLGSFAGANPGGSWTRFVADVSAGGQYRLESWSLAIALVPEPSAATLLLLGGVLSRCFPRRPQDP